jgi:hypothetical protein
MTEIKAVTPDLIRQPFAGRHLLAMDSGSEPGKTKRFYRCHSRAGGKLDLADGVTRILCRTVERIEYGLDSGLRRSDK